MTEQNKSDTTKAKSTKSNDKKESTPLDDIEVIKALELELNKKENSDNKATAAPKKSQTAPKKPEKQPTPRSQSQAEPIGKVSKTAVVALLVALISIGGIGASYFYQQQTFEQQLAKYLVDIDTQQSQMQQAVSNQVSQNQSQLSNQITQSLEQANAQVAAQIAAIEAEVNQSKSAQPNDWSLHEAEFLIRAANRTLLLDKNKATVKALLMDADKHIASLNDPQYLPLRAAIRKDIEQLAVLPNLDTDEIILSLMALNQQVNLLALPQKAEYSSNVVEEDKTLSNEVSDWRENLYKTWIKVRDEFITVRKVSGSIEPLLSPNQQQNLIQNLSLKLQVAQWAATQQSSTIYLQTLTEIETWLNQYFDMAKEVNNNFLNRVNELKQLNVTVNYPDALTSLQVVRDKIENRKLPTQLPELEPKGEENSFAQENSL